MVWYLMLQFFDMVLYGIVWYTSTIEGSDRVADAARAREQRSPKGQGLLRKEGPTTYAILSRNLVLSRFMRFLKGFHIALIESHPAFKEH